MTVTLYNYTGMDNVANKLLSRLCTKVWEGTITTYGAFTPRGGHFVLSNLYQCNYATFQYDGITYYANVDISTDSKGLYVYDCTTDSLATAYYKGCMNSWQYYKYISNWTQAEGYMEMLVYDENTKDQRVSTSTSRLVQTHTILTRPIENPSQYWYCVNILDPWSDGCTKEGPSIRTYAMDKAAFDDFVNDIVAPAANITYLAGIQGCYAVPRREIQGTFAPIATINVFRPTSSGSSGSYEMDSKPWTVPSGSTVYNISARNRYAEHTYNFGSALFNIDSTNLYTTQLVHVQDVGDIHFTFSDVGNVTNLWAGVSKIGYVISYDFTDGVVTAALKINDDIYWDFTVTARIPYELAIMTDAYLKNMKAVQYQYVNNALNVGANLMSQNVGGAVMSAANGAVSMSQMVYEEQRRDSLTPTNVVGNASNSTDNALGRTSYVQLYSYINNAPTLKSRFGYMYFDVFNPYDTRSGSGNYFGYFMTQNCTLSANGLPRYVIKEADMRCDAGYIIAPSDPNRDPYTDGNILT